MAEQNGQQPFEFTGSGWEYFKIWIVNLLLTIVTLGIYSAWAKVRRLQYFYRNTRLADASFEYHGTPMAILKGRLIGIALLLAYNAAFELNPLLGLGAMVVLSILMPWLLMRSLRFKFYNSSYRGLRFGFTGNTRDAYSAFLKYPALAGLTFYLLAPLAHQRIKQYQLNNARFGSTSFRFTAPVKEFYIIYLSSLVVMLGALLLGIALILMAGTGSGREAFFSGFMIAGPFLLLLLVVAFLVVSSLFGAYVQNLVWNHTQVGVLRIYSVLSARRLLWIRVTNFLAVVCTLGLFVPFATIRLLRFRLESMGLLGETDLSVFVAGQQDLISAAGEESAEIFDVDLSF